MHTAMSTPLTKALGSAPGTGSPDVVFGTEATLTDLDILAAEPSVDGCFDAGVRGTEAPQQILVMPYSQGQATYEMRVWGWWHLGSVLVSNNKTVWVPLLIAKFDCVSGTKGGIGSRLVKAGEYMAATMTLTAGSVGDSGHLGAGPVAWAKIDLQGCRKFQLEFTTDGNALWAKTSSF